MLRFFVVGADPTPCLSDAYNEGFGCLIYEPRVVAVMCFEVLGINTTDDALHKEIVH